VLPEDETIRRAISGEMERSMQISWMDRRSRDPKEGMPARRQACRSGVSAVAVEVFVNNAG
jgi:hypothetical protein